MMSLRTRRFLSLLRSRREAAVFGSHVQRHLRTWNLEDALTQVHTPSSWNGALQSNAEAASALELLHTLRLPEYYDDPHKVWDGVRFLAFALHRLSPDSAILDLGSGPHSNVLFWLDLLGYRDLWAADVVFRRPVVRGHVHYAGDDMVRTRFPDARFDCVLVQSSLEHGVSLPAFFAEATRLLRPAGHLLISTDYWPEKVDTRDTRLYGSPWTVFSADEIRSLVTEADRHGLEPIEPLHLEAEERVIGNKSRRYTFLFLALRKVAAGH